MKRWIVVVLIVLAVVVLVSPGIVGRLAEKNIEENIEWADNESPSVSVTTEHFDRGWFTSEGRHRVVLKGGSILAASELYTAETGNAELPSLLIDTRIDHGPLPLTSLSRDSGSLLPGLASTVSTFQLDLGNGELIELPGVLYSEVDLAGASQSHFLLESGSFENEELSTEWEGADLSLIADPKAGAIGIEGGTEPFSISQGGETIHVGAITIDVQQNRSDFGFNVGTVQMEMGAIEIDSVASPFGIGHMSLRAENEILDDRMNARSAFLLDAVTIPNFGDMDLATEISIERLDAASLRVVTKALQEAQAADDPEMALQMLYPQIEGDLETLVAAGGVIRFDQFDLALPQGTLETKINFEFAELDEDATFSWPAVLLAMTVTLDMKLPPELYEFAQMLSPEAASLVAMGILVREGDYYVIDAEYAQGLLNVNGAPMPIPMPGM